MKFIIFLGLIISTFSGCTLIKGGKELQEIIRTIQENTKRYGSEAFHIEPFLRCDVFDECTQNPNYILEHSIQKNRIDV